MAEHCEFGNSANIWNGLNGFQFSYDMPADDLQSIVQAYASANDATYDVLPLTRAEIGIHCESKGHKK